MDKAHLERFWQKVNKNGRVMKESLGNCWEWTAGTRQGYGAFAVDRKTQQAHVLSYIMANGPVESGQLVRHKCDNRPCVRPDHLMGGTRSNNAVDMVERNRNVTQLTTEMVSQARRMARDGESVDFIQRTLSTNRASLVSAIQGITFKHVPEAPVSLERLYRPIYNKLTEEQYKEILIHLQRPYRGQGIALAREYNVHPSLITLIKKKKLRTIRGASTVHEHSI